MLLKKTIVRNLKNILHSVKYVESDENNWQIYTLKYLVKLELPCTWEAC